MRWSIGLAMLVVAAAGFTFYQTSGAPPEPGVAAATNSAEMVAVTMPVLEGDALIGSRAFAAKCAACHGANAGGIDGAGPPLVHKIYEPGHHGDMAFVFAARRGVKSHHWRFGDMPPVAAITDAEIAAVITFVRTVQRENGIF